MALSARKERSVTLAAGSPAALREMCTDRAPLIPRLPGHCVKTDRHAALKLDGLLRADLLTVVHPPAADLCRHAGAPWPTARGRVRA